MAIKCISAAIAIIVVALTITTTTFLNAPMSESHWRKIFGRGPSAEESCVPEADMSAEGPARTVLTEEELETFQRDGVVVLRGVLNEEWLSRLRQMWAISFRQPSVWDVLYSRMVANFYCAQKAVFLHTTSTCGREIAMAAPTTWLAGQLLESPELVRIAEPTEALANFRHIGDGCGHTAWHRDDLYMPIDRKDPEKESVVRFWIPLQEFSEDEMRFQALNNSREAYQERKDAGFVVAGTDFALHDRLEASGILDRPGQRVDSSKLRMGDLVAFAQETPHIAQAFNCTRTGGCPRLILSFAGSNAVYLSGRLTSLMPLHGHQEAGEPIHGTQYPQAMPPNSPDDWKPLKTTYGEVLKTIYWAMRAGLKSFWGYSPEKCMEYINRVGEFAVENVWDGPSSNLGNETSVAEIDLEKHFKNVFSAADSS